MDPGRSNRFGIVALSVPLVAGGLGLGCGGMVTSDPPDGAPGGAGAADDIAGGARWTGGAAPVFHPENWRSVEDTGEPVPSIVNAAIHGVGPDAVFVAGYRSPSLAEAGFIDRRSFAGWVPFYKSTPTLSAVWAASPTQVFAANYAWICLTDGSQTQDWSLDGVRIRDLFGFSADDVLAVGDDGLILNYNGREWLWADDGFVGHLRSVWGSSHENVFAVGAGGAIVQKGSTGWTPMTTPTALDLNAVWGSGPNDVYAVGGSESEPGHVILHFDGAAWEVVHTGDDRRSTLISVWGRSASDLCAVGGYRNDDGSADSLVLHFDGVSWTEIVIDAPTFLWGVWPRTPREYLVVGPQDTLVAIEL